MFWAAEECFPRFDAVTTTAGYHFRRSGYEEVGGTSLARRTYFSHTTALTFIRRMGRRHEDVGDCYAQNW